MIFFQIIAFLWLAIITPYSFGKKHAALRHSDSSTNSSESSSSEDNHEISNMPSVRPPLMERTAHTLCLPDNTIMHYDTDNEEIEEIQDAPSNQSPSTIDGLIVEKRTENRCFAFFDRIAEILTRAASWNTESYHYHHPLGPH